MSVASERVAVLGLGYVGLPLALALARKFPGTVGFDINASKVAALRRGQDPSAQASAPELLDSSLRLTSNPVDLAGCTFFILAVPTPLDGSRGPDLAALRVASEMVGGVLRQGGVVCVESTVYPGVTEGFCGPLLARASGLTVGSGFTLAYSPERANPGDREHTLQTTTKVVSAQDAATLQRAARVYGTVVEKGLHLAPSIAVAEAAKVIENTQRDLNIALMNELSLLFERVNLSTRDVLAAASTKWNFVPFTPGLVGGHCVGVDPYYLTAWAAQQGYHPQVVLAGRHINDGMGTHVAQRLVKLLVAADIPLRSARVGVLGLTFKENVPDCRNSRVPDIVAELAQFGITSLVHDPLASPADARTECRIQLAHWDELTGLDGVVLAVKHASYACGLAEELSRRLKRPGVIMDVKWMLDPAEVPPGLVYASL